MTRWRHRLIMCAGLGVLTTIVIAWVCALLVNPKGNTRGPTLGIAAIDRDGWRWTLIGNVGFGSTQLLWTPWPVANLDRDNTPYNTGLIPSWSVHARLSPESVPENSSYQIDFIEDARGWPLRAFRSWRKTHTHAQSMKIGGVMESVQVYSPVQRFAWLEMPGWINRSIQPTGIPLMPLWSGFLADSALFGATWFVMLFGPGMVRRGIRRRRGCCPMCAYDLRRNLDAGCPECGWNRP